MHLRIRLALRIAWVLKGIERRKRLAHIRALEAKWLADAELNRHTVGG